MRVVQNIFTQDQLETLRSLNEVVEASNKLSSQSVVSFTVPNTEFLQEQLQTSFGLDLSTVSRIPFRWIKGDTLAHIDRGSSDFDTTYLVYLTDGEGEFKLGEEQYPITAGTGFSFDEGLRHEVVETNGSSRLLLGPMSESGLPVGAGGIVADGATDTVYIKQEDLTYSYKVNDGDWFTIPSFPCTIFNNNATPEENILKVLFTTNMIFTEVSHYFILYSSGIQIGATTLDSLGSKQYILIDGVVNYPGLLQNGLIGSSGNSHIYIYNLNISSNGVATLDSGGGWIGQAYFGKGASNNYIVNCSSSAPIRSYGGGIVGQLAGSESGAQLTLRGCSSYGDIETNGGGIVGYAAGYNGGSVTCEKCWSKGAINAQDSGGIFGSYAGNNNGSALALQCYSTGLIVNDAGGIFGGYAADSTGEAYAQKCYSTGAIQGNGGGIFSRYAAESSGTTNANNCYSSGTVATSGYGIYGVNQRSGATSTNCYVANGNWSDSSANTALIGVPSGSPLGTVWVKLADNSPYELNGMGYTPYSTEVINSSSELIQNYNQTIEPGQSSVESLQADASGNAFILLEISGGDPGSYNTISMSVQTGAISTSTTTSVGTYTITLRSTGSYNITTFTLTILTQPNINPQASPCCVSEMQERGLSYEWINDYRIGNRLIVEHSQNPNLKFNGYSEYIKYKMAQNARK